MSFDPAHALYAAPLATIWYLYGRSRQQETARSLVAKAAAVESGLHEPASLHPSIDPAKCLGCGACVNACPEGDILGIIDGRAHLIEPSQCIGHGACKAACPFDAISLVFGTESRGVDLPVVGSDFQTNVPGSTLPVNWRMGLIRNAIEQGRQAVNAVAKRPGAKSAEMQDLIIVGAGPAGFSASLAAKKKGLSFKTFDQETLGGTVAHFPRGKLVMTRPAKLPIVGEVTLNKFAKEDLLEFWHDVQHKTGLSINFNEGVTGITQLDKGGTGFEVQTSRGSYKARNVCSPLAGADLRASSTCLAKSCRMSSTGLWTPSNIAAKRVLVVGGGDSAIEAAASLADQPGTTVTVLSRKCICALQATEPVANRNSGAARPGQRFVRTQWCNRSHRNRRNFPILGAPPRYRMTP